MFEDCHKYQCNILPNFISPVFDNNKLPAFRSLWMTLPMECKYVKA